MKKEWIKSGCLLLVVMTLSCLGGCGKTTENSKWEEIEKEQAHQDESKDKVDVAESQEDGEADPVNHQVYYEAYGNALRGIIQDHVLPNGEQAAVEEGDYDISKNSFAVHDVDGDGKKELIISWGNQCMAAMAEYVYEYRPDTDSYEEELREFPGVSYYEEGIVTAPWSHNQTNGYLHPYTIYEYNKETNQYHMTGQVSSWDKELCETDYEGNPFPEEVDEEGTGVVYDISYGNDYTGGFVYSQSDYEIFYQKVLADRKSLDIRFHAINMEMIELLQAGELDPVITGKILYPRLPKKEELDVYNLPDGIYQVQMNPENIFIYEGEAGASMEIYLKETYDKEEMNALKIGDGIEYDGEIREIKQLEKIEYGIAMNGGLEQGGAEFSPVEADDGYEFCGFNDVATYRSYGETYLYMTPDCIVYDYSDIEVAGGNEVSIYDFPEYAQEKGLVMICYNTSIRVENGKVAEITIFYMP